jgi:serine phosphatase RsbU (regulator of sigma subunit)
VLFFTDGVTEAHPSGQEQFGQERFISFVEHTGRAGDSVQEMVRALSRSLTRARGSATSDDATLLALEWRGGSADYLATIGL